MSELVFTAFGVLTLLHFFLKVMKCLRYLYFTRWHKVPHSFFSGMGEWAVITGASDGIGKEYAHELARRGLNIVLVSRTQEKLTKVADEIEQFTGRQVKIVVVDFTKRDIYNIIEEHLRGLEIGILINNVGMLPNPHPSKFLDMLSRDKTIDDLINVNMLSVIKMTQLILPQMKNRDYYSWKVIRQPTNQLLLGNQRRVKQKGLILNISSGLTVDAVPLYCLYNSSKIFMERFSNACKAEYGSKGIIIQNNFVLWPKKEKVIG
ncbi:testosterone 17-beta-dehydrogenase 3 isoform X2 [Callorhinchus milii]|uniref:testosterone 17-beta-dehydrogenase 3 isoform X2 n=1 Tax=Callorhinchus milii TaxID=7868 RepID=UPI0004572919|nr:testosterone 17-beta-dehydrogenase 3 isoform X2 [Callorhinchus milii]|eukprot:gi/632963974/ref/XP_007898174.1/ PREDICTED: testosterone 17-beta-dehydrogenase 3 isoform X3 [Callorhinchus milii]